MLSESNIIHVLKTAFPDKIGDDAAILKLNSDKSYVISKDLLVEDTHFRLRYQDAASLAHKALHVNLSDIAAMGATPQFVLLGLSIPTYFESELEVFLNAFSDACKSASVMLIGGDTTQSSHGFFMSVTAIGLVPNQNLKTRSHAKPGDLICVAGNLGHAHLGLTALETCHTNFLEYKQDFLKPTARINEGVWFGQKTAVTGMMDLSDGLYLDLKRFCEASDCAGEINLDTFKPKTTFRKACLKLNLDPIATQLTGGEDYSLMITISPEAYETIALEFKQTFDYDLIHIGVIDEGTGVQFLKNNKSIHLDLTSFSHFGETN